MAEKYFNKFPQITYANTTCVDITKRPLINNELRRNPSVYQKYVIKTGARADLIADNYYQDPYFDWLLYVNNGIIDPYFDWYMNDFEFNDFITKKYESIDIAQKKIAYYELNYLNDQNEISVDYYNNHLPYVLKKYFTPIYSVNDTILSYTRKAESTIVNSNQLVQLTFSVPITFLIGDIIDISDTYASAIVGGGEVVYVNYDTIVIKNITGDLSVGNNVQYDNDMLSGYSTIISSNILHKNISDDEFVYWKSKSLYDVEFDKNEENRNIRILSSQYASGVADALRKILK